MDKCRCYLCEKLCYGESQPYEQCTYRRSKSFGLPENRMYEEACTRLAMKFARKHGRRFDGWVGYFDPTKHHWYEGAGGHAMLGDEVIPMDDIRADLLMDAPLTAYTQYMDEQVAEYNAAESEGRQPRYVNYRNWLLGARHNPEQDSPEYKARRERELKEAQERTALAQARLEDAIREQMQRNADELLAESDGLY